MREATEGDRAQLTRFLNELAQGRPERAEGLMPHVEAQLRGLAQMAMAGQGGHTLQPTALVNEAYLRLFDTGNCHWNDRNHFYALAARVMRQILSDHARAQRRLKRGGALFRITLDERVAESTASSVDLLDLDEALADLSSLDERQGRIVELRFFGGLAVQDVAELLDLSLSTVEREWRAARAWLGLRLEAWNA